MKKRYIYIILVVMCLFGFKNSISAKTFTYNPSIGYAKSGNQGWTGYSINNFDFSGATWKTIRPSNSPTGVMFEYGLPSNVKGVLSFSIIVSGQFKSIPIVTGYFDGNYFTCNNSGVPTYNTGDEGYYFLSYYCDNFDSSGRNGYNNLQFQFNAIYDPVNVFGVTNFMVVNDDINVSLYELNTKLISINSNLSGISGQIDSINSKLDSINSNQQATTNAINSNTQATQEQTNTIKDDSVDSSQASGFFEDFQDNDHGLSGIITAPLNFIRNLSSSSCSPISLTIPFVNNQFNLPCFSTIYSQHFNGLFQTYRVITFGIIAYWVSVKIFALVKGFRNPDDDRVEVLDL